MAIDIGSAIAHLLLDTSEFMAGWDKSLAKVHSFASGISSAGQLMTAALTVPIVGAGAAAFAFATDFETAMAKVETIADPTSKSIQAITEEITDLSDDMGVAATEIAEATYQAISAGIDTADSVAFVEQASKLAVGGFSSVTTAVDLLTTTINAYGFEMEDAEHISNVLISTQNKGKTTVDELAQTMGKIIPTANNFNVSLEDLGTSYAFITANGIATAEATTYLNGLFNEMGDSSSDLAGVLNEETGKSFAEITAEGSNLRETLEIIKDSADKNGIAFNDLFGSQEAAKAALSILNADTEEYNDTLEDFTNTTEDTNEAFETMAETTETKLNKALENGRNRLVTVGDTLIDMLLPYIEEGIELLGELDTWLKSLSKEEQEQLIMIAGIIAIAGPLLIVLGSVISAITAIGGAVKALFLIITAHPIGALITLIAALVAGLVIWTVATSDQAEAERKLKEQTAELNKTVEEARSKIDEVNESYKNTTESIKLNTQAELEELDSAKLLAEEYATLFDANGKLIEGNEARAASIESILGPAIGTDLGLVRDLIGEYELLFDANGNVIEGNEDRVLQIEGELSSAFGTEVQGIEDITEANQNLLNSINELVEAEMARVALQSFEDEYKAALERSNEIKNDAAIANLALLDLEEDLAIALAGNKVKYDEYGKVIVDNLFGVTQAEADHINSLNTAIAEQNAIIQEAGSIFIDTKLKEDRYMEASVAYKEGKYDEVTSAALLSAEQEQAISSKNLDELSILIADNQALRLAQQQEYDKAFTDEQKAYWAEMIETTTKQGDVLIDEYNSIGSESGTSYGNGLLSTDPKILEAANKLKESTELGLNSVDSTGAAHNVGSGFIDTLSGYIIQAGNVGLQIGSSLITGINTSTDSHSPSREAMKAADNVGSGLLLTLVSYENIMHDEGYKIGRSTVEGINDGFAEMEDELFLGDSVELLRNAATAKSLGPIQVGNYRAIKDTNGDNVPITQISNDTYVFESPKAIDEIEAARLLRQTKLDLAGGF